MGKHSSHDDLFTIAVHNDLSETMSTSSSSSLSAALAVQDHPVDMQPTPSDPTTSCALDALSITLDDPHVDVSKNDGLSLWG